MINIYNESQLHKALKTYYASQNESETEVPYKKWITDIMTKDGRLIEIQTGNLTPLKEKALSAINDKKHMTFVHPVITEKKISTCSTGGTLLSKRKSPKRETVYSALKSLTGVCDILLNKYITLILIEVKTTEERIATDSKTYLKNKSRRFAKNWYKSGKSLTELGVEHIFKTKKDYLKLLPSLPEEFSSKELKDAFINEKFPKSAVSNVNLLLWLLAKMNLIELTGIRERRKYYLIRN